MQLDTSMDNPQNERRTGPVTAVVLAAGRSSRMGRAKQLEVVDGEPMVVRAVRVALASGVDEVLVVTGAYAEAVEATLTKWIQDARLRLVHNPDWATGQASSVQAGTLGLAARCAAVLFLPTDQPFAPPALLQSLIEQWRQGALLAAPTVDGAMRGAPAIFDRVLFPDFLQLTGDIGARPLFQKYRKELVLIPAEAQWLRDIDTPDDL